MLPDQLAHDGDKKFGFVSVSSGSAKKASTSGSEGLSSFAGSARPASPQPGRPRRPPVRLAFLCGGVASTASGSAGFSKFGCRLGRLLLRGWGLLTLGTNHHHRGAHRDGVAFVHQDLEDGAGGR